VDNTNCRASGPGRLEGHVSKEKRELSAGCTEDRRVGWQDAQKGGPAGCGKGRGGLQKRAILCPAFFCRPA